MSDAVMVALSGGVDSSLTAALLVEQGCRVVGATLKTFCYGDVAAGAKACCGLEGVAAARALAARLGIEHCVFDVEDVFRREVIADFVTEYAAGRTPNPCVRCNATVKIPWLLQKARSLGFAQVATGHYARVQRLPDGTCSLLRGLDPDKDQSYFLWELPFAILPFLRLPIGELAKSEVRAEAVRRGLPTATRPDSQEICFVPEGSYLDVLRRHLPPDHAGFQPGLIVDTQGRPIGSHDGYLGFTIGQRKGIGGGHARRRYVVAINPTTREVTIGEDSDTAGDWLLLDRINLLVPHISPLEEEIQIQIRHRSKPVPGKIVSRSPAGPWRIELAQPVRAITPGQSGVLYRQDQVVAGGRIRCGRNVDDA